MKIYRYSDDKGNLIYNGNVLYDTSNKKFWWVKNAKKGTLVSIEDNPKVCHIEDVRKHAYLKLWINNAEKFTLKDTPFNKK